MTMTATNGLEQVWARFMVQGDQEASDALRFAIGTISGLEAEVVRLRGERDKDRELVTKFATGKAYRELLDAVAYWRSRVMPPPPPREAAECPVCHGAGLEDGCDDCDGTGLWEVYHRNALIEEGDRERDWGTR